MWVKFSIMNLFVNKLITRNVILSSNNIMKKNIDNEYKSLHEKEMRYKLYDNLDIAYVIYSD